MPTPGRERERYGREGGVHVQALQQVAGDGGAHQPPACTCGEHGAQDVVRHAAQMLLERGQRGAEQPHHQTQYEEARQARCGLRLHVHAVRPGRHPSSAVAPAHPYHPHGRALRPPR